jgi:hypothetical protein
LNSNNSAALWLCLSRFPAVARRKGEALYAGGKTSEVEEGSGLYWVNVEDHETYAVSIGFEGDQCNVECECPVGVECVHAYAAMLALLARESLQKTRQLSEGSISVEAERQHAPARRLNDLEQWVTNALGRSLILQERQFTQAVQRLYTQYIQSGHLSAWDFQKLGWYNFPAGSSAFCEPPADVVDFWGHLAYSATLHGLPVPEFLGRVTDLGAVETKVARARRQMEIQRWKYNFQFNSSGPTEVETSRSLDLRVIFYETQAHLQWKMEGDPEFRRLRQTHIGQLGWQDSGPDARLRPEAELLRAAVLSKYRYGDVGAFTYTNSDDVKALERALRSPTLESRLLSAAAVPLKRPAEVLRWKLEEPEDGSEDYLAHLVMPDGSNPPHIILACPGGLYVTQDAVFAGPLLPDAFRSNVEAVTIPAPAVETQDGANFLAAHKIDFPAKLRQRVRTSLYKVSIRCRLVAGARGECCEIRATAAAKSGPHFVWEQGGWCQTDYVREPHSQSDEILVFDKSSLNEVAPLLAGLPCKKTGQSMGELLIPAGKKFGSLFAEWIGRLPAHVDLKLLGELESFRSAEVAGTVRLEVTEAEIDWFDLKVVLNVSDTTLTADEVNLLLAAKGGYVRLEGKGWRRLRYELSDEDNASLAKLGLSASEFGAEPQRLHALQLGHEAARKFISRDEVANIERRLGELKTRVTPAMPASVSAQLREYQVEGYHFLAFLAANRFGGILADDMGLGKTLQTLTWLAWLHESPASLTEGRQPSSRASLVVCPKSVMDNWATEAARFAPSLRVKVWNAETIENLPKAVGEHDLHVINYAQLRLLSDELLKCRWLAAILDEGQYIKNPASQTAELARKLQAQHRLVLTGTPIENRLLDLWSLMAFAMPGVLGSRTRFTKFYDSKTDPLARERLAARVRPFLLRRTKNQVAKDLPDKIEEDLLCEMEGEQLTLYRAELKRAQQMLLAIKTQKELAQQQFNFLTSLLRLRQICCDPRLLNPSSKTVGAKTEALLEQIEPLVEEGQKVLVFSQFVEMLHLLREAMRERGWRTFFLSGETEDRGDLVNEFNRAAESAIFLISLKAGGFGLNLASASYVVLFDPWWNPAVENQAIDRTHRIGQVNKVIAYRLLIKNSVEEKIRALQRTKSALADNVLGEERFAQSLSLEDLRFLLQDAPSPQSP